jgi:hypothetical protein
MEAFVEDSTAGSSTRVARKGSHRRCGRCGKVVSRRTLVCRRCGKRQRLDPRATLLACTGLFFLGIFAVATAGAQLPFPRFGRGGGAAQQPVAASAAPAAPAPGEAVTATELWGLYSLDTVRANARFKNRPVSVTGRVSDVRRDLHGDFVVRLGTDQPFETVRATVTKRSVTAHTMPAAGQTVTLACTGQGALIGSPILDACAPI